MNDFTRRRELLAATLTAPLLTGCLWPRFFDFGWDEEVQLHDGRVIVVKVKYTYERLGGALSFNRYDPSILRKTEISFDAGKPIGRFKQLFEKHRVDMVEQFNGKWYLLLERVGGLLIVETADGRKEAWGPVQNSSGHKCWSLDERGLVRASINDLPDSVLKVNLLMDYAPTEELAAFDGTRLTLSQKNSYAQKYPLDPPRMKIERPQRIAPRSK